MKFLRKTIKITVISIIVIILALTAVVKFVDPSRVKPIIAAEVLKQTGYQLTINGEFSWSFYPRVGIKAQHMQLTAPKQTKPFLVMEDVILGVDFLQLLQGKRNLSGDVHVKQLTLMNLQAKNLSADLQWEDNVLTVSPVSAELYDGWMSGIVNGRNFTKTPNFDWDVQFSRVQLKPLLRDLQAKDTKLSVDGMGELRMEAETSGLNKDDMLKHLQGKINFSLSNGVVTGIDLNYLISSAVKLINGKPANPPQYDMKTSFESLTGTMKVKHGVGSTDDTVLVSSAFTVKTVGSLDLTSQAVDYSLDVVPQNLEQFKWGIPILVTGHLQDPSVKLDMLKVKAIIANEEFQHVRDRAKEKLKDLPKGINKFLGKVFGGE